MSESDPSFEQQQAEARIKSRRINRNSTWAAIVVSVGLAVVSFLVLRNSTTPYDLDQVHKNEQLRETITLMAFQKMPDGTLKEFSGPPQTGETVAFKLAIALPEHITLAVAINGARPVIISEDARIPPGPARLLEKQDTLLTYTVQTSDKTLRFCVIGSDDTQRLARKTAGLAASWDTLPTEGCLQVK